MNYKRLGNYIQEINIRNTDLKVDKLLGVSIQKAMMPSIANTVGTDMSTYKIVKRGQFAYGPVTSRNGDKISIALLDEYEEAIISQAYTSFEVIDKGVLLPEYLMMWFRRPEFDRYARFKSHGSAREIFDWDEMCSVELPIPSPEKQREIVAEYNAVQCRIDLNNQLIQKLEETAQAIYKQWFVDFEFPNEDGKPYKSSGGEMVDSELGEIPRGWRVGRLGEICSINSGKSTNDSLSGKNPVYGAGGIIEYIEDFLIDEKILIIGRVGTHGKVFRESAKCWPTDNTLLIKSDFYNYSYFILFFLNYDEINRGGVQALITQTDIKAVSVLFPDAKSILNQFEVVVNYFFELIDISKKEIFKLKELQSLLLSKMARIETEK
ncbi:restriction endonuclease subunit S [Bacteroidales bacterium OttesenSCG-928-I14]|nr:restriction endonuclease subunit S [Bacteroidales bacterium OttesenSCG-928-I14]